ncbi:hypothetical protein H7X69_00975 [Candidatus Saccharibacteria bacterium]|nr:hypothetical protein [Candidatus Saccharibacteria bacterium]
MIEVIHYTDPVVQKKLERPLGGFYNQARALLPGLPENMKLFVKEQQITEEIGTSGFAYSHDIINLEFDKNFPDQHAQMVDLRGTIFHESYHIKQSYTLSHLAERGPLAMIETSIYEGCATVFEREHAGTKPLFGDYKQHSPDELDAWLNKIRSIKNGFSRNDWEKWAFYNPELKEKWIIYKLGTHVVDKVLSDGSLDILDLQDKSAKDILALADNL